MRRFLIWTVISGVLCCFVGIGAITAGAVMGGDMHWKRNLEWVDWWDEITYNDNNDYREAFYVRLM